MRIHLIENEVVINTIEAESVEYAQSLYPDLVCAAGKASIGYTYKGGKFAKPTVTKEAQRQELRDQIAQIERDSGCVRSVRELLLKQGDSQDVARQKLKVIDDTISQLRDQLWAI